jgi:hypothetical protein
MLEINRGLYLKFQSHPMKIYSIPGNKTSRSGISECNSGKRQKQF